MAIIDTLSLRFEAEAGKALTNVQNLERSLKNLSEIITTLSRKNISLGIKADTGNNIKNFAEAIKSISTQKLKSIANISQGIKSLSLGIGQATAANLTSFGAAVSGFNTTKFAEIASTAREFPGIHVTVTKATAANLDSFATALNNLNADKFNSFAETAKSFTGIHLGFGSGGASAFTGFAQGINTINLDKFKQFVEISGQMTKIKTGLTTTTAKNVTAFGAAVEGLDLDKLRELAAIDFSNVERLGASASQLKGIAKELSKFANISKKAEEAKRAVRSMRKEIDETSRSSRRSTNIFSRLAGRIKGLFRTIGRVAFMRAIRSALRALTQGFAEGTKALYFWSQAWNTSFAPKMDQLATATKYLRNGFASMFSPLIEHAVPIIDTLIDKLVDFFNLVQEGIAKMFGLPTWNRALKVPVKFAQNTEDATASVKELKNQLMGFDELNVLSTPTDNGSNSNNDAEDYASMFELMTTGKGGLNIGKALADAINSVFENPEKFEEYGETLAKWIRKGFDKSIEFIVSLDTGNIGESAANFVSGFNTELANQIKEEDFGEAQTKLAEKLAELIDGLLVEGNNGHIKILDSLKKLISSIVASIPSIILGSLESMTITFDPILRKLGLTKLADKFKEWQEKFKSARKQYEASKGTALSSLFQYIDTGNWEPQTSRGFEYDPTQDNGRSFDENGAVLGGSVWTDLFGGKSVFDDEGMEGFKFIKTVIEEFKKFYEDNKGTLDTLFKNILLTAEIFAPLIKALAKIVGTQAITEFIVMTTTFLQSLTPALESLNGVLSILNGILTLMFGSDKKNGFDEFLSGIENIGASILRLIVSPFKLVLNIMDAISSALATFLPEGKAKEFILAENRLIRLSNAYLDSIPDSLKKTPEQREKERKEAEATLEAVKKEIAERKKAKEAGETLDDPYDTKIGMDGVFDWISGKKNQFFSILKGLFYIEPDTGGGSSDGRVAYQAALPFTLKPPEENESKSTLNKFWTTVKSLWGKDKWVGVSNRITGINQSIRDGWDTFKLKWGDRFANISERVTNITSAAKDGWAAFRDKWGDKFANVNSRIVNITSGIKTGWQTFKDIWGNDRRANATTLVTGITDSVRTGWDTFKDIWGNDKTAPVTTSLEADASKTTSFLGSFWQGVVKTWGNKELNVELTADGISVKKFTDTAPVSPFDKYVKLPVTWKASGGYLPNSYSLYGMGENGVPEILGTVGGRNAVAGGAEITGIRDAIYEQGQREEALLRNLITAVNNKDLSLVANSSTGRWVNRALNAYAGVTG